MKRPLLLVLIFVAASLSGCIGDGTGSTPTNALDSTDEEADGDSANVADIEPSDTGESTEGQADETEETPTVEPAEPEPEQGPVPLSPPPAPGDMSLVLDAAGNIPCTDGVCQFAFDWDTQAQSVQWWFGDGFGSSLHDVRHKYAHDDQYDVRLTVTSGSYQQTATAVAKSGTLPLGIDFVVSGADVAFTMEWGAVPDSISWDFGGDGSASTPGALHRFSDASPRTITLSVSGEGRTATTTTELVFDSFPLEISAAADKTFQSLSFNWGWTPDTILWVLGDGATSEDATLTHNYPDGGQYVVSLTVTTGAVAQTEYMALEVPTYPLSITATADGPDTFEFAYTWGLNPTTIAWDLGDATLADTATIAHTYVALGTYTISLTVDDGDVSRTGTAVVNVLNKPLSIDSLFTAPGLLEATFTWIDDPGVTAIWEFGDGTTSNTPDAFHGYTAVGEYMVTLTTNLGAVTATATAGPFTVEARPEAHVIVGVPDTGINPYHEIYYRPARTLHPCTYVEGFPCDIPALPLSVGLHTSYAEALAADAAVWATVKAGDWYWIPQTNLIAVNCEAPYVEDDPALDQCILDDSHMHGTGTTSSVLMENPDALIVFSESLGNVQQFVEAGIPVDIYSVSWGAALPGAGVGGAYPFPGPLCASPRPADSLYVKSSGNAPGISTILDCGAGHPDIITVGGAYAEDSTQEPMAYKEPDVVSYFCRPTAQTMSIKAYLSEYCGTSFSAPTVAGALSKVVLELRRSVDYPGNTVDGIVVPELGITLEEIRAAMNLTATFEPASQYPNAGGILAIPLLGIADQAQWSWGFYDGTVADATIDHLLGITFAEERPVDVVLYNELIHAYKQLYYNSNPGPIVAWLDRAYGLADAEATTLLDEAIALVDDAGATVEDVAVLAEDLVAFVLDLAG